MLGITDSNQKIITQDLKVHYDAAQLRSYVGTGTTWTDISGNGDNNTLTNGPTFNSSNGGSIVFDGSNDYSIGAASSNTMFNNTTGYTLNAWIYPTDGLWTSYICGRTLPASTDNWAYVFFITYDRFGVSNKRSIGYSTNALNQFGTLGNVDIWSANVWQMITTVHSSTTVTIYYNGVSQGNSGGSFPNPTQNTSMAFSIGVRPTQNQMKGRVGVVQAYNRVLTATEILQNYNATKSRYGL